MDAPICQRLLGRSNLRFPCVCLRKLPDRKPPSRAVPGLSIDTIRLDNRPAGIGEKTAGRLAPQLWTFGGARMLRYAAAPVHSRKVGDAMVIGMPVYYDDSLPEYQFLWQCLFSRKAKRLGKQHPSITWKTVTELRTMSRRKEAGGNPSWLDFKTFGPRPYDFLTRRHHKYLDKAIRLGESHDSLGRRGMFDALRHHKNFRSLPRIYTRSEGKNR